MRERARDRRVGDEDQLGEQSETERPPDQPDLTEPRERDPGEDAGGDPRDGHAHEGLGGVSGELLEWERIRDRWPVAQDIDVAQDVEPAEPRGEGDDGEDPRSAPPRRTARRRRTVLLAVLAACLSWLCAGVCGVVAYGHNYWVYRGFAPPRDPVHVPAGRLLTERFWSPAMRQLRSYQIYLPPGYAAEAAGGRRFPVLYLLHGSPGGGSLFINAADIGVALDNLIATHRVSPFLIVMPDGSDGTFMSDTEWADTSHGDYEGLVIDAVHAVDARWPTLAARRYRALGGNSEGAYGAVNIALRHLSMFGTAESWSGYFVQDRSGVFARASLRALDANSPAVYVRAMRAALHRFPFHAYIYSGRDEAGLAQDDEFARALGRKGAQVEFRVVPGGHDWATWRAQAPATLLYLGHVFGGER